MSLPLNKSDLFENILRMKKIGVWEWGDPNSDVQYWSDEFKKIVDHEDIEIGSANLFFSLIHETQRAKIKEKLTQAFHNDKGIVDEFLLRQKNGTYQWVRIKAERYINPETSKITVIGSLLNIHKEKERADLLETYMKLSYDGYWDWYLQDDYEYMSPRFWEIFGFEPHEKRHDPKEWQDLIFEDDLKIALENFEKHVATKGRHPFKQEVRYRHKNGSTVWVICKGVIIDWGPDGKTPIRMVGTHTDITQQKLHQMEIQDNLDFLQLVINSIDSYIFVKDTDYRIVLANDAFIGLYPKESQDKIIGYTTVEKYDKDEAEAFLKNDKIAFETGESKIYETLLMPDEIVHTLYTQKKRFFNTDNQAFILAVAQDVTEQQNMIAALNKSNKDLDDFAYIASHDLREPLRGIFNHISFLEEDHKDVLDDDAMKRIDRIKYLSQRMERLTDDLLYFSRLRKIHEAYKDVDLNELLDEIKTIITSSLEKPVTIHIHKLPKIHCDMVRVAELFRNLITNGLRYNDEDDKIIEIGVDKTQSKPGRPVFYVKDNGIGIDEKFHDAVFTIFKRLNKRGDYGDGTGSGLTFVKKIVEGHNGKIWISSEKGSGSTFYFTLS